MSGLISSRLKCESNLLSESDGVHSHRKVAWIFRGFRGALACQIPAFVSCLKSFDKVPALNTKVSSRSELELEKKREKIVSEAMKKLLALGEKNFEEK